MKVKLIFAAIVILVLVSSCRHRLRPILYKVEGGDRLTLDLENCYYMDGFTLSSVFRANPLTPGRGKVLVTNHSIKDPGREEIRIGLIKAVGEIMYRIYVALPEDIAEDSINIAGKSVCYIIGLYDLDDNIKHYLCNEGYLKIDSVRSSRFHAFLSGKYYNIEKDSLIFEGDLNVKRRK